MLAAAVGVDRDRLEADLWEALRKADRDRSLVVVDYGSASRVDAWWERPGLAVVSVSRAGAEVLRLIDGRLTPPGHFLTDPPHRGRPDPTCPRCMSSITGATS